MIPTRWPSPPPMRDGRPSVRIVLLRRHGPEGFGFFTNLDSRKGLELATNPWGALAVHWKSLRRQVRAEGPVEQVGDAEADAYFAGRSRDSRIGSWASDQSRPLESRAGVRSALPGHAGALRGRRRAAPAALVGLPPDPRIASNSGPTARTACTSAACSPARDDGGWDEGLLYP